MTAPTGDDSSSTINIEAILARLHSKNSKGNPALIQSSIPK